MAKQKGNETKKVRLVFCGCGHRAKGTGAAVRQTGMYEVIGVCDPYSDKAEHVADVFEQEAGLRPKIYTDHEKMFDELKPDAALVVANWEVHVKISIDALRRGIAVAMEVGGAYNEEECFELVRVYEETKTPFMFMENCCFNREELLATNLVRHGLLGKISYCSGAYGHDIREEVAYGEKNRHYRLRNYIARNCDNYPTHDLGPIAKMLDINRGNRMVSLVSLGSKSVGLHDYVADKPELKLTDVEFKQSDIIETLIKCENGELIRLTLDTTLPRFYSRQLEVRGSKGWYCMNNDMVYLDEDNCPGSLHTAKAFFHYHGNADNYKEYLPDIWTNVTDEIIQAGHGGMDYFEFVAFADCLLSGKEMPVDVYDAVSWMCITYLTERSIAADGAPQQIPDFTHGLYKTRKSQDVVPLPIIKKK